MIAVGDGLGSADQSDEGSELATNRVITELKEYLETVEIIRPEPINKELNKAFERARASLFDVADKREVPVSALGTTLLAVVAGPSGMAGAIVGDGGIVCDVQGSYEALVSWEQEVVDLAAQRYTYPITHTDWRESYRFGYRDEFDSVAVFSDGIEEVTRDGTDLNPEFFDAAFDLAREFPEDSDAQEELTDVLGDSPYTEISGDDKTLVIGYPLS